jgi:hypothetical protein
MQPFFYWVKKLKGLKVKGSWKLLTFNPFNFFNYPRRNRSIKRTSFPFRTLQPDRPLFFSMNSLQSFNPKPVPFSLDVPVLETILADR